MQLLETTGAAMQVDATGLLDDLQFARYEGQAQTSYLCGNVRWERYGKRLLRPAKCTSKDLLKVNTETGNVPGGQEISSRSESRSIASTSDLTELGDLAEVDNLEKKKKG